ncbi:hypothetical protein KX816_06075 [Sphingosinicellaceae bacterium]|nr:hypothetical protein KX816_06075 [Sphingosinicellaceae bacterium]
MALDAGSAAAYETGVYVGGPNGNDPKAMARFKHDFDAHIAALNGRRPKFFNTFTDFGQPTAAWISSANWGAWSAKQSGRDYLAAESGMIPLVGVPLASNTGGWGKVDTFYQEIIAGKYDAIYAGIVDAWAGQGYKTVDFRIAYEMNGNFMPWAPGNSKAPAARANFVAAFRHVADIIHARAKEKHIRAYIHWNPCAINDTSFDVQSLYPGDAYVDVISTDLYSPMYPLDLTDWSTGGTRQLGSKQEWADILANRVHYWHYPNASARIKQPKLGNWGWSLEQTIAMAKLHNKPIGFDEAGSGAAKGALGRDDEPEYPRFLAQQIARIEALGITVRNVNIWDTRLGDGDWEFKTGRKPLAAKVWAACFGTEKPRAGC